MGATLGLAVLLVLFPLSRYTVSVHVFRLVNSAHSPITTGTRIDRLSHVSNMKLGEGLYFAETELDLVKFFSSHHGYTYTHLLECDLHGIGLWDFFDLATEPNELSRFESNWTWAAEVTFAGNAEQKAKARRLARYGEFAASRGKKGLRWQSRDGWVELVLQTPYWQGVVEIVSVTGLAKWKATHGL